MAHKRTKYYRPTRRRTSGAGSSARATFNRTTTGHQSRHIQIHVVRQIVSTVFLAASILWFGYFFLFSDNFVIKSYEVTGTETIPKKELEAIIEKELEGRRMIFFSNRNMLLFSKESLKERIGEKYIVEDIDIDKRIPFELAIHVDEKLARVILRTLTPIQIIAKDEEMEDDTEKSDVSHNNEVGEPISEEGSSDEIDKPKEPQEPEFTSSLYYLDVNGIIVSADPIDASELEFLPVIEIETTSDEIIVPGDSIMDRETIEYIFSVYEAFQGSQATLKVAYVHYDKSTTNELIVTISEGWQVFLSTRVALETQVKKLELALQEKIGSDRDTIQYVDLRVKDRVYFK